MIKDSFPQQKHKSPSKAEGVRPSSCINPAFFTLIMHTQPIPTGFSCRRINNCIKFCAFLEYVYDASACEFYSKRKEMRIFPRRTTGLEFQMRLGAEAQITTEAASV